MLQSGIICRIVALICLALLVSCSTAPDIEHTPMPPRYSSLTGEEIRKYIIGKVLHRNDGDYFEYHEPSGDDIHGEGISPSPSVSYIHLKWRIEGDRICFTSRHESIGHGCTYIYKNSSATKFYNGLWNARKGKVVDDFFFISREVSPSKHAALISEHNKIKGWTGEEWSSYRQERDRLKQLQIENERLAKKEYKQQEVAQNTNTNPIDKPTNKSLRSERTKQPPKNVAKVKLNNNSSSNRCTRAKDALDEHISSGSGGSSGYSGSDIFEKLCVSNKNKKIFHHKELFLRNAVLNIPRCSSSPVDDARDQSFTQTLINNIDDFLKTSCGADQTTMDQLLAEIERDQNRVSQEQQRVASQENTQSQQLSRSPNEQNRQTTRPVKEYRYDKVQTNCVSGLKSSEGFGRVTNKCNYTIQVKWFTRVGTCDNGCLIQYLQPGESETTYQHTKPKGLKYAACKMRMSDGKLLKIESNGNFFETSGGYKCQTWSKY